jgi:hypothetical protein
MGQLPSPALLLDRRARGLDRRGQQVAQALAVGDLDADQNARDQARRAAARALGSRLGLDRGRSARVSLRGRDLQHRARDARYAARPRWYPYRQAARRCHRRTAQADRPPPARAGAARLAARAAGVPRGQDRAPAGRPLGPGPRPGARRRARERIAARTCVQPPARRLGRDLLRQPRSRAAAAPQLPAFVEWRAAAAADREYGAATRARSLVRAARARAGGDRRVPGQRAPQDLREPRRRRVHRAERDRARGAARLRPATDRPHARGHRVVLCHHRGAQDPQPSRSGAVRARARVCFADSAACDARRRAPRRCVRTRGRSRTRGVRCVLARRAAQEIQGRPERAAHVLER